MGERGQSATELAVFGAILIFLVGLIVRTGMNTNHAMNNQLRAMRMALAESYMTAEGVYNGGEPQAARNSSSFLLIEDRLSMDPSDKFQTRDRIPYMTAGSGTMSKLLFYPIDYGDTFDLPVFDVVVNGQRFPFTTAGFSIAPYGQPIMKKIWRSDAEWDPSCAACFDLNRDGVFPDVAVGPGGHAGVGIGDVVAWQWQSVGGVDDGELADFDADRKQERVIEDDKLLDYQLGDVDFTRDSYDDAQDRAAGQEPFQVGIQDDVMMYSFTGLQSTDQETALRVEEGKLYDPQTGMFMRTTNTQDHLDIVQRSFHLSNNTGRFCDSMGVRAPSVSGMPNPVEVCSTTSWGCFSAVTVDKTCMSTRFHVIFIRSRIHDVRAHKWVTRFTDADL